MAESKSPEMQRETRGRGRGKEGKGETCNEILVLICPYHRFVKSLLNYFEVVALRKFKYEATKTTSPPLP